VSTAAPAAPGAAVAARELAAADFAAWRELVARSEQGGPYALPEYLAALCAAAGGSYRIVGVFLNGQLAGGLALYETASRAGRVAGNRTLLYYNGVVLGLPPKKFHSDRTAQLQSVLGALERQVASMGYAHVLLHCDPSVTDVRPFLAQGWTPGVSYTYVVPLDDLRAQWERIDQNLRRLVKRCEKDGVAYREDADIGSLFRLHLQTHERKGAPLYLPEPAFRRYFEQAHAAGLARLGHAVFEGKVIASQLMLTGPGKVAHTVCAGADEDYLRMGASAFLRWRAFESLAQAGYTANDLTDASLNPVTRFKSQLGGELRATLSVSKTFSRLHALETTLREVKERVSAGRRASSGRERA
jgi:CelD/BcsL family acetyltransferase involved in cellulose biosynthesis